MGKRKLDEGSEMEPCPHLPPYAEVRNVVQGDFLNRNGGSYPDGENHYCTIGRCQGTQTDGKPCDYKCMLQNAYLPLTRFRLANGEIFKFKSWTNPVACRNPGDVVRAAQEQVEGKRGWHKFWFAVYHIGAHVGGQQHASQDQLELWTSWLRAKAKDFNSNMNDFQNAGLLVEGGPGDGDAGVRDKFTQAKHVLGIIGGAGRGGGGGSPPKTVNKRKREATPLSPGTPETVLDEEGFDRRVKQDVKMPQSPSPAPPDFPGDPRTFIDLFVLPQSLPCPLSGGNGEGMIGAYNPSQLFDGRQAFADSFFILGAYPPSYDGGGGGGGQEGGLEMFPDQFRPMFLVLLDAMHNVQFSDRADAEREEWAAFEPQQFYCQGGADVQLAQIIGGYLHSNILQSPTLREFFDALPTHSDALSKQFHRLLTVPRSAAVAGVISAIYCFWRIQQELLHPMYAEQLASWYSVKESLLEILTELQQGAPEDQICTGLQGLFDMMNRKVRGPLKDLHANFGKVHASRRFNTGSFAEVVWAPRIWCFFVMLRLRHDEDFSRALWDKGFRFVACDLDPAPPAPENASRTEQGRSAGVLADGTGGGGGGGGGGVVAANPFAEDANSPEMLVARLLKEEGRELDDEARAADGEAVPGLPLLSERVSKTRQRMTLLYQNLPLIPRPPSQHDPTMPPLTQVATSEFVSLFNKLSSCRQSEREAMDLLDKETYDMIFKARASTVKGGGGGTRSATRGTRGGGGSQRGQSEEKIEVERVLSDLHDFRDASGFWTSDWVLQVTVKQHDGKDDEEGEHIDTPKITKGPNLRLYTVDPDLLIRVTVKNLSSTRDISLMPVYVKDNGEEEPEDIVELKSGECFELPFPLQKEAGEEEDGWAIKDSEGKTVLKLRFTL